MKNTPTLGRDALFVTSLNVGKLIHCLQRKYARRRWTLEMIDNDIKALAPVSDENDPGDPLPDDDVRTHVFPIDPPTDFIFSMANAAGEERSKQQLKYSQELVGSNEWYGLDNDLRDVPSRSSTVDNRP
ncbi:uncharacterized protein BT62DRAFT_930979 [Guyanagaster necrorhizus]|uniref:Uncharacterized protein n=1 Tax=Guyanagaster necrorhizus TaxID=856835 RepID=A0A9P8ATF4_9AGAR|nr:uncharacterized protein BT62DRAFT_930979 [Guyanagaster necrorhizus MCA 3950]KAG7447140.1 hypothetical protein BT62DRAFT_930979 [Guyanagaster necrorhizus MCA 3950]